MRIILPLILLSTLLSGCVGVIAAGAGSAATAMIYDQRDIKVMLQDQNIVHRASLNIKKEPQLKGTHINVSCINHRVLLTGQTASLAQKRLAERIARKTQHVKSLVNAIDVHPNISPMDASKDAWITTQLKTQLLRQPGLHSVPVKIITERRTVYLMGLVSKKEADIATRTARQIKGVKEVINLFETIER